VAVSLVVCGGLNYRRRENREKAKTVTCRKVFRPGISDPFTKKKCPKITESFQFSIQLSSFPIQYNSN
jgi:hypothetical protein